MLVLGGSGRGISLPRSVGSEELQKEELDSFPEFDHFDSDSDEDGEENRLLGSNPSSVILRLLPRIRVTQLNFFDSSTL